MRKKREKVDSKLVWKALFNVIKRHCLNCEKDFECYYSCEKHDIGQDRIRKRDVTFCYCPKCYQKYFTGFHDKARDKCHLLK